MIHHPLSFVVVWDHNSKADSMIDAGKTRFPIICVTEPRQISPQTIMTNSPLSVMIKHNKPFMLKANKTIRYEWHRSWGTQNRRERGMEEEEREEGKK